MVLTVVSTQACASWAEYVEGELDLVGLVPVKILHNPADSSNTFIEELEECSKEKCLVVLLLDQSLLNILLKEIKAGSSWNLAEQKVFWVFLGASVEEKFDKRRSNFGSVVEQSSRAVVQEHSENVEFIIHMVRDKALIAHGIKESLRVFPEVATPLDPVAIGLPETHQRQTLRIEIFNKTQLVPQIELCAAAYQLSATRDLNSLLFIISSEDLYEIGNKVGYGKLMLKAFGDDFTYLCANFKLIDVKTAQKRLEINLLSTSQVLEEFVRWSADTGEKNEDFLKSFYDERLAHNVLVAEKMNELQNIQELQSYGGTILHFAAGYSLKRTVQAILQNPLTTFLVIRKNAMGQLASEMTGDVAVQHQLMVKERNMVHLKKRDIPRKMEEEEENYVVMASKEKVGVQEASRDSDDDGDMEYTYVIRKNNTEEVVVCKNCEEDSDSICLSMRQQLSDIEHRLLEAAITSDEANVNIKKWVSKASSLPQFEQIIRENKKKLSDIEQLCHDVDSNPSSFIPKRQQREKLFTISRNSMLFKNTCAQEPEPEPSLGTETEKPVPAKRRNTLDKLPPPPWRIRTTQSQHESASIRAPVPASRREVPPPLPPRPRKKSFEQPKLSHPHSRRPLPSPPIDRK